MPNPPEMPEEELPAMWQNADFMGGVYWRAYRELELMDDEAPDFTDEILLGLLAFFQAMSVFTSITQEDE